MARGPLFEKHRLRVRLRLAFRVSLGYGVRVNLKFSGRHKTRFDGRQLRDRKRPTYPKIHRPVFGESAKVSHLDSLYIIKLAQTKSYLTL